MARLADLLVAVGFAGAVFGPYAHDPAQGGK